MPGPFDSVHDEPSPFQDPPSRQLPPGSVVERGVPRHSPEGAEPADTTKKPRAARARVRQVQPQGSAQV